jgi:hypothetical protein
VFLIGHSQVRLSLCTLDFSKAAAPKETRIRFDAEAREIQV